MKHPLENWSALASYKPPPGPTISVNWDNVRRAAERDRLEGQLPLSWRYHGGAPFFKRLHYIRGFENPLIDFMTDPPELHKPIDMVLEYNHETNKWLEISLDVMGFGDDFGTQNL
ncbi:MAG: hypothetical protein QXL27_04635 [Candidatus Bathyarchaeia archaeon]